MNTLRLLPILSVLAVASCSTVSPQPNRFDQADLNHDGKLTRDEVYTHMVSTIFEARDTNHDKLMTKAEWNTDMSADEVKLFKARDTNHDGVVSLAEAIAYSKKMKTYDATIKEADKNKDGFISREEAVAFYADKAGPVR